MLWAADEVLKGVEDVEDAVIAAAESVVYATQVTVDGVIQGAEDLVDGVMNAIAWVVQELVVALEDIATAIGWLFNLQSISVGAALNVANQEAVWAEITVGFFGTQPRTYGFMFDVNNVNSAVSACVWFGQPATNNWFNGKLAGTPAAAYQAQISQAMAQSSVAAMQIMGMSPAEIIQPPIGPSNSSSIFAGETFTNAPGTSPLTSPQGLANLAMSAECNLYVNLNGATNWQTKTNTSNTPCTVQIVPNGNALLTDSANNTLWQSHTAGTNASYLYVADDGNLYLTDFFGDIFWTSATGLYAVEPGVTITDGEYANSQGQYVGFAGQDIYYGNCATGWDPNNGLVVYRTDGNGHWLETAGLGVGNGEPWALANNGSTWLYVDAFGVTVQGSNVAACNGSCILGFVPSTTAFASPASPPGCELAYMNQAMTIVYQVITYPPPCPTALYPGNTLYPSQLMCGWDGSYLIMQTDNNLVWYSASRQVYWASGTMNPGAYYYLVLQSDNNLVIYNSADGSAKWSSGTAGYSGGSSAGTTLSISGNFLELAKSGTAFWVHAN